jgi:pentatricopeptide repeat protein
MWEHGGCLESVQQDAILRCGHLDSHDIGACEMWERQKALELFHQMQQEDVQPNCVTFVGVLNACGSIVALKRAGVLMCRSFNVDGIQMSLCRVAWLTCMQNVGAWRMLGECSIRCHHMM